MPSNIDWWTVWSRSAGSSRSVPSRTITEPIALPPAARLAVPTPLLPRSATGTIATSEVSGSSSISVRYFRIAPLHMARTTSLTVVPEDLLIARRRSSGQSCAAKRREPVIGWFSIVRGA